MPSSLKLEFVSDEVKELGLLPEFKPLQGRMHGVTVIRTRDPSYAVVRLNVKQEQSSVNTMGDRQNLSTLEVYGLWEVPHRQ